MKKHMPVWIARAVGTAALIVAFSLVVGCEDDDKQKDGSAEDDAAVSESDGDDNNDAPAAPDGYAARIADFKSKYGKSEAWADWMLANRSRYASAFSTSKSRPGTIVVSFHYESAPVVYNPAWASETAHMAGFKALAEAGHPGYTFSFVFEGNAGSSFANVIGGMAVNSSYSWGKEIHLYHDTIFNHEFGHRMQLLHHYDNMGQMGNGNHMPPGDTKCTMDRTSTEYCSACETALGLPLNASYAAAVTAAMNNMHGR